MNIAELTNDIDDKFKAFERLLGIKFTSAKDGSFEINTLSCASVPIKINMFTSLCTILLPIITNIPIYTLSWLNVCFIYATTVSLFVLISFIISFIFAWLHIYIYNKKVHLCSKTSVKNHHLQTVILFASMGATLGSFNLYTYDPSILYIISATTSYLTTIIVYFSVLYQKHHYQICPLAGQAHGETNEPFFNKFAYADLFTFFSVMFCLSWVTLLISVMVTQGELWKAENRNMDILDHGCVNFTIG